MKITYHWMREYTSVTVTPAELAAQLTLAGLEVEAVEPVAPPFTGVVVGEVLSAIRHPNAEKLSLCEVTTDGNDRLQIVCGAPNVRAGLKVAVAMVGATLPGDVRIKRAKLRGIESNGMLCSSRELGLGTEHDGIMELSASVTLGADIRTALDLDDTALEVNATPNRGDCMSVFGIARDYTAAQEKRYLTCSVPRVPARSSAVFPVTIEIPSEVPVFTCRVIRGVKAAGESPAWLRERLRRVGLNSISPIVDVTNYVMIGLGQPLHAYDLQKLAGGITVRLAHAGERATLLDDKDYTLEADHVVITDANGVVGLGGIMGGKGSSISDATTDVLLEAAHFTPDAIAGRARRLGLFTDAAQRFERGVDPGLPAIALEQATKLLLEIAGGEPGPVQITRGKESRVVGSAGAAGVGEGLAGDGTGADDWVSLRRSKLSRLLGVSVPDDEVKALLTAVTGEVQGTADGWRARRPAHRFDIRIEADLVEEVARLRGFDSIAEQHARAPQIAGVATESRVPNERLLTAMADAGYREVITYSFVDPQLQRQLFPDVAVLALGNAISAELSEMRVSLWTGLVQAARDNVRRQQTRVRIFEIGKKFDVSGAALHEVETLAGVALGQRLPEQWGSPREALDFYDVKADLMALFALTGNVAQYRFEAATLPCLRPGRTARIYRESTPIGWLGEVHPQLIKSLGVPAGTLLFEIETDLAFLSNPSKYNKISKFPSIRRDLAIVIDESVPLAVLQENVTVSASGLLTDLIVFDVYRGPGVEIGRKSIALRLILQDSSRTLTDLDGDAVVAAVVARLRDELSASIRDQ